ncbi:chorismate mutase [Haploplasma axanthum]|uniref:Chorismate mutase n=1 Tax=Haploplasma axanthum TaxID=29552 RepID=A0A449BD19_HAPAX|nr:chorismate mutase [Haploplasma axanthum]VEU80349.1 chorismate mutase [Haploplasma axanthum]
MINELRKEIDEIDTLMQDLFKKRLAVARKIGEYKKEKNLPIYDSKRENEILLRLKEKYDDKDTVFYYERFMKELFSISKDLQNE